MFDDLIAFQPDQPLIRDVAVQLFMLNRCFQALVILSQELHPSIVFEIAVIEILFRIGFSQLLFINQGKYHPVHKNGFKDFRQVQGKGIPAETGFMEKADRGVELGPVEFG